MTLLVVLVLLVAITLLGVASIRISGSNMQIVGNMQARRFIENIGLQAVEQVLNSSAPFNAPTSAITVTVPAGVNPPTVSDRRCTYSTAATGYSAVATISPEDNFWEFDILVTDALTGARTRMTQGVKVRQLAGSCT